MNIDLEQIMELDRLNMGCRSKYIVNPMLPEHLEQRKRSIIAGIEQRRECFILCQKDEALAGYIQYRQNGTIISIQIHPKNKGRFVLIDLLSCAYHKLKDDCPLRFRTFVSKYNTPSIRLHKKLGFVKIEELPNDKIRFEVEGSALLNNIKKYIKRDNKSFQGTLASSRP